MEPVIGWVFGYGSLVAVGHEALPRPRHRATSTHLRGVVERLPVPRRGGQRCVPPHFVSSDYHELCRMAFLSRGRKFSETYDDTTDPLPAPLRRLILVRP